jgi:hypothetical protein
VSLQGRIEDAASGVSLPLASVQVVGTYSGTIANDDGFFMFDVPSLPVTLRVTYIGYSSQELTIADSAAASRIEFGLLVTPHQLPEMIVRPDEARRTWLRSSVARRSGARVYRAGRAKHTPA